MPELAKCRSCGATILWARTASTGALMPLNADPDADGNIALREGLAVVMRGDLFEEMLDGPRFVSHFATCPNTPQHRKPHKRGKQ